MKKEGAIERKPINNSLTEDIKALEGTKCKAPHKHNWGEVIYHNAMICSIMEPTEDGDIEVCSYKNHFRNIFYVLFYR